MVLNQNRIPATSIDFKVASSSTLRPGLSVHVEEWPKGMVFKYVSTSKLGTHTLKTPKTGRKYLTRNRLLHVKDKDYV